MKKYGSRPERSRSFLPSQSNIERYPLLILVSWRQPQEQYRVKTEKGQAAMRLFYSNSFFELSTGLSIKL
jgi:hypothetical protein